MELDMLKDLQPNDGNLSDYSNASSSDEEIVTPEDDDQQILLTAFREWIGEQPHFVDCRLDDNFLLRFLHATKFNLEKAQVLLDRYLTVRTNYPYCYQNLDIEDEGIKDLIAKGYIFPLPERDSQGRFVIFGISEVIDLTIQKREDVFRTFIMTYEALLEDYEFQERGVVYAFDQAGINLNYIYQLGLRDIQRLLTSGEKALPIRHKVIHWVNLPRYLKAVCDVFKTFLSPKLQKRLIIIDTFEELPEDIPVRILPKEYGGEVPLAEMTSKWMEKLKEKRDRLLDLNKMGVDESKRPKAKSWGSGIISMVTNLARLDILSQ